MAGPNYFDQFDTAPAPVYSAGPKPPAGFVPAAASVPPIAPLQGGPDDPNYVGQRAGATAAATVGPDVDKARQIGAITLANNVAEARAKAAIEQAAKNAPKPVVPLTPQQRSDQLFEADATLKNISAARDLAVNGHGAGWWSYLDGVPGTDALSLYSKLDAIKSDESLANMAKARQESPSGSLGMRVTNFEAGLFANKFGSLNQKQSPADLADSLDTIAKFYKRNKLAAAGIDPDSVSLDGSQAPSIGVNGVTMPGGPGATPPGSPPSTPPRNGPGGLPPLGSPGSFPSGPGGSAGPGGTASSPPGGGAPTLGGPTLPSYATGPSTPGGTDPIGLVQGGFRTEADPALAGVNAHVSGMLRAGASADDVRGYLARAGIDPTKVPNIDSAVAWRGQHPDYHGNYTVDVDKRQVPMSTARTFFNNIGQGPIGAAAIGGADAATFGTLDNMTDNPALSRAAMTQIEGNHPLFALGGMALGGAATGAAAEGGLGALGVKGLATLPGGFLVAPRAMTADVLIGGAYSAGSADDGNRLGAGLLGGATGVGAGVLGRRLINGMASAAAPTGGALAPIYDAGVRPTLGQRFANTGAVGKTVNTVEQALQSIPVLGGAVRGARDASRDQFERGAFNAALGDIGQTLPADMPLGTQPHAFMQGAFNDAYARARSGMNFIPDGQYVADRRAYANQLGNGVLSGDQVQKVGAILDNAVTSRLQAGRGALNGDAYKAASSDIGSAARKLSGTDPLVSDALTNFGSIFDDAARRNSHPDAVAALDAADSGYAKAVRIEQAAAARGGDTGRFSPTQFDRSVQQASGGVRSRAYLRGDALMGDYATAGKSLVDTLPDSGTPIRQLVTGGALGGLAHLHPVTAAAALASVAPYAPGARAVVGGAMAPTNNAARQAVSGTLRRYKGMFAHGAIIPALQWLPQTP